MAPVKLQDGSIGISPEALETIRKLRVGLKVHNNNSSDSCEHANSEIILQRLNMTKKVFLKDHISII